MGIISPRDGSPASKALLTCLVIILSPLLILAVFVYLLWGAILYLAIWLTFRKQFAVFVYSDSPIWKDYIEREILPHLGERVVILNWSERRKWKISLPVLAFRTFGGYRNFNPIGIIIRPFRFAKTYRFFEAFKEFKQGGRGKVEKIRMDTSRTFINTATDFAKQHRQKSVCIRVHPWLKDEPRRTVIIASLYPSIYNE